MVTNISDLRKEAYRLWGVSPNRVVYNFPKLKGLSSQEFYFKLDYSKDKAPWPKAYALAVADDQPLMRIIVPVIMTKQYHQFSLKINVWYDMPVELHEQIVRIVGDATIKRPLPKWQRAWNKLVTSNFQFSNQVCVEDYVFAVCQHNANELLIRAT
jgi:hypothetical protein